jgi:hypothetical protein
MPGMVISLERPADQFNEEIEEVPRRNRKLAVAKVRPASSTLNSPDLSSRAK